MFAIILAFIFYPVYGFINKKIKSPNVSAFIVSFFVILVFILSFWVLVQITVSQIVDFYAYTQTVDMTAPIKAFIVQISNTKEFPVQLSFFIDKGFEQVTSIAVNFSTNIFKNLPILILQAFVAFFVMFYFIRDGKEILSYLKSIMPFKEPFKDKFFIRFKEITNGVIYGMIIVGIIQGLTAGIGYYIFGVQGAFVLTLASVFLSIFPFIGPWLIYIPTGLLMIAHGNPAGLWLIIYGVVVASQIDNVVRPYFIGKRAKISMALALVGMLGGMELFGVIGLVVGPLIVDYTVMFIEFYKTGKLSELV
jgi:predicted PurR-regulated permease PerM